MSKVASEIIKIRRGLLPVFEDHALLYGLVYALEFFDVGFVRVYARLVLLQTVELVFQGTLE